MAATITTLPLELLVHIMGKIESPRDLGSLIMASKSFHELFLTYKRGILLQVLRNTVPHEVEDDFCMAVRVQDVLKEYRPRFNSRQQIERFREACVAALEDALAVKHPRFADLTRNESQIGELMKEVQVYHDWFEIFSASALQKLGESVGLPSGQMPAPLSRLEKSRMTRAFCRYEVYVRLLQAWMHLGDTIRGFRPSLAAGTFIEQFYPWEIEEIACVDQFLQNMMGDIFNKLEKRVIQLIRLKYNSLRAHQYFIDTNYGLTNDTYWTDQLRRNGLQTIPGTYERRWRLNYWATIGLKRASEVLSNPHLGMALRPVHGFEASPPLFYDLASDRLARYPTVRDGFPNPTEPIFGWTWAFDGHKPVVMALENTELRNLGYVFWDEERLLEYDKFKNPRSPKLTSFAPEDNYCRTYHVTSYAIDEELKDVHMSPKAITALFVDLERKHLMKAASTQYY